MSIDKLLKNEAQTFSEDELGALGEAVNSLIAKQNEIADLEYQLKLRKSEERKISQETIPSMMGNLGFERITLKDGRSVMVKDSVQASIPAAGWRSMDMATLLKSSYSTDLCGAKRKLLKKLLITSLKLMA